MNIIHLIDKKTSEINVASESARICTHIGGDHEHLIVVLVILFCLCSFSFTTK